MYAFRIILLWNYYTILVYLTKGEGGVHLGFKNTLSHMMILITQFSLMIHL